jgi:hypothetical protein
MQSRVKRRLALSALAVAMTVALVGAFSASAAFAADQSVTVDMSTNLGAPNYKASGFLYGLSADGTAPAGALLADTKPQLFRGGAVDVDYPCGWEASCGMSGYEARFATILAQANRAKSLGANYQWLLSDTWNDGNVDYPGDGGNWSPWEAFLTQAVDDALSNNMTNVEFDIWNEPDNSYFWPRSTAQYDQMWITAVQTIRSLDPSAVIVGPDYSTYNSSELQSWLTWAQSNSVLPNILSWHFAPDPVTDVAAVEAIEADLGITSITGIYIGEYIFANQENAGYTAWYLSRMQQSDALGGDHGVWGSCCETPDLSDILTSSGQPTGQWWSYAAYGEQTGNLVTVTDSADIAGTASTDSSRNEAYIMLGDDGSETGNVTVNITNLNDASYLVGSGEVHVVVSEIPNGAPQATPPVSLVTDATVVSNAISVRIPWSDPTVAYSITLTPYSSSAPVGQVVVNDTDPSVTRTGTSWAESSNRGFGDYDDDVAYTTNNGDSAQFTFTGTSVEVIGEKYPSPGQGNVQISIDGGTPVTVSTTAASREAQQVIYTSPTLSPGSHTVTITKESGTYMVLDAFAYMPSNQTVEANNTTTNAVYTGTGWGESSGRGDGDYDDDVSYTANNGDYATFSFTGTSVTVIGEKNSSQGNVQVAIDGGTPTTVSTYSASSQVQQAIYTASGLSDGPHTITITKESGTWMTIDAYEYLSSDPPIEVNNTTSAATYTGTSWSDSTNRGLGDLGDDLEYTTNNGDYATFSFTGTSVQVIGETIPSPYQGNVQISVDGGTPVTVSTTSSSDEVQQVIYTSPTLSAGTHTIKITKESGTYMTIDGFRYQ